jgi:hypothetical protein
MDKPSPAFEFDERKAAHLRSVNQEYRFTHKIKIRIIRGTGGKDEFPGD